MQAEICGLPLPSPFSKEEVVFNAPDASTPRGSPDPVREAAAPSGWVPDAEVKSCQMCAIKFGWFTRKAPAYDASSLPHAFSTIVAQHHCRFCGNIFCGSCCSAWTDFGGARLRACNACSDSREAKRFSMMILLVSCCL